VKATAIGIRTLTDYSIWLKYCQQTPSILPVQKTLAHLFVAIDTFTKCMEAMPVVNITQDAVV
jgi:hypothetical protein